MKNVTFFCFNFILKFQTSTIFLYIQITMYKLNITIDARHIVMKPLLNVIM